MRKFIVQLKRKYKGDVKRILAYGKYLGRFRAVKRSGKWMMEPRYEDDWNAVENDLTDLEFLIVRKRDLWPIYRCRYPYGIMWKPIVRK